MSGLELLAIPIIIVGMVSASKSCTDFIEKWKKRKVEQRLRSGTSPERALQDSLAVGGSTVQNEYHRDVRRLGELFARGDVTWGTFPAAFNGSDDIASAQNKRIGSASESRHQTYWDERDGVTLYVACQTFRIGKEVQLRGISEVNSQTHRQRKIM
ncbi:MAG: hypothetical protein M1827_003135 [Pycnora praestabilis]|nr:MAG: hypothetical protein M1827_003135 [Pycnora praestabilis]